MDPELAEVLPLLPSVPFEDPQMARAGIAELLAGMHLDASVTERLTIEDRSVPGPPGAPEIAVRVYRPAETSGPVPGVLWIHGGGFVVGSVDTEHVGSATAAAKVGAVVVSVEYRLAPEHPFPAGVEDCYAALRWLARRGRRARRRPGSHGRGRRQRRGRSGGGGGADGT